MARFQKGGFYLQISEWKSLGIFALSSNDRVSNDRRETTQKRFRPWYVWPSRDFAYTHMYIFACVFYFRCFFPFPSVNPLLSSPLQSRHPYALFFLFLALPSFPGHRTRVYFRVWNMTATAETRTRRNDRRRVCVWVGRRDVREKHTGATAG